jgi:hypothetical protein
MRWPKEKKKLFKLMSSRMSSGLSQRSGNWQAMRQQPHVLGPLPWPVVDQARRTQKGLQWRELEGARKPPVGMLGCSGTRSGGGGAVVLMPAALS